MDEQVPPRVRRSTLLSTYRRSQDFEAFLHPVHGMSPLLRFEEYRLALVVAETRRLVRLRAVFLFEFASIFASLQGFESIGLDVVFREFSAAASLVDKLFVF